MLVGGKKLLSPKRRGWLASWQRQGTAFQSGAEKWLGLAIGERVMESPLEKQSMPAVHSDEGVRKKKKTHPHHTESAYLYGILGGNQFSP